MIGKTVNQYKILEKLGEGGMGVVYKAEDTKLHRLVALKFLPLHSSQDDEAKKRFMNEARAASALDHPNICTLHEIGDTKDGQMYMTMAYYGGQSLKDKVEDGRLQVTEAVDIAIQTAKGLARAHEEDITHRDIKPANLMVTERGEVKIVDFGLAKLAAVTKFTKSGMTLGTVSYMSPEQAQGIPVDHRTDIWSLGVVLYEMLTGEQPFQGDYDQAVVYSLINEQHEPLTNVSGDAAKELEIILDHALAKKTEDRYQTADEMLADLLVVNQNMKGVTAGQKPARLKVRRQSPLKPTLSAILIASFLVLAVALWFFLMRGEPVESVDTVSLAVLPLKGFGEEASQDWFLDSMTDALITDLTKIGGMRVISQSSSMRFKDSPKSIPEIAKELHVEYVIDASIIKVGEQVRLSAKLVNASTNENLWAENFQRTREHILTVQAEFALAIARQVKIELTPEETGRFTNVRKVNPEAHEAYLKGLYHHNKITPEGIRTSIKYFARAVEIDSNYALAYAGLASSYYAPGAEARPLKETMPKARTAALKALKLDPSLGRPHLTLGLIKLFNDWNISGYEREVRQALELTPNNAETRILYAQLLNLKGRHEEAVKEAMLAKRLDPLNLFVSMNLAYRYVMAGQYDNAIQESQHVIELDPNFAFTYGGLGEAYLALKKNNKALQAFEKLDSLSSSNDHLKAVAGYGYGGLGEKQKAKAILGYFVAESQSRHVAPIWLAIVYSGLGDKDKAFEALEQAYEQRTGGLIWVGAMPYFKNLRSDPRFDQLAKKIGLRD